MDGIPDTPPPVRPRLVPRHHEQIIVRFLPAAEEQILADQHPEHSVYLIAGFHVIRRLMVRALILFPFPFITHPLLIFIIFRY